jgi:hypothetical protein
MTDPKSLLLEVLAAIPDGEKVAPLFAEDGVVELPILHSVGIEPRYEGRAAIAGFYDVVKQLYPDFEFKPEDTHVLIETSDQVFAEYTAHTTAAAGLFRARLSWKNSQISSMLRTHRAKLPQNDIRPQQSMRPTEEWLALPIARIGWC